MIFDSWVENEGKDTILHVLNWEHIPGFNVSKIYRIGVTKICAILQLELTTKKIIRGRVEVPLQEHANHIHSHFKV